MEAKVIQTRWGTNEVRLVKTWVPNETGELAIQFATHFGMVAAKIEGEDSGGRSKMELQSPDEVVDRACEMAELLVARLKKKNWIIDLPDLPDETAETPPAGPVDTKPEAGKP